MEEEDEEETDDDKTMGTVLPLAIGKHTGFFFLCKIRH